MSNRDATKKARGFSYQRQYGIYLFFNSINSDVNEIIEEGSLDGSTYEDITIKNNNNEYITYQIKYHTGQMRLNRSNNDLFKTIKNENNLQTNVKKIYFIVSKNGYTFDKFLSNWKNKKLSSEEIYNSIINLKGCDTKKVKIYKECKTFLENNPNDKINYIDKIIIEEGFTYNELIIKINEIIKNIFNLNDEILIFYIRYYVFDLFDKNWFSGNVPLKINDIYYELKMKFNTISSSSENIELFNYTFNHIIDKIKKYIVLTNEPIDTNNILNLYQELNNFINQLHKKFKTKHYLCFLMLLHKINKKQENKEIIQLYNTTIKYLCRSLIKNIKTDSNTTDEKIDKIISSISYYHKHNINKLISLSKSEFRYVLSNEDLSYINNIINTT
jgi:hypothetical protein